MPKPSSTLRLLCDCLLANRSYRLLTCSLCAVAWVASFNSQLGADEAATALAKPVDKTVLALFQANCFDCHGGDNAEGGLKLDELVVESQSAATSKAWLSVLHNVRAGTMPPPDSGGKLAIAEVRQLAHWIKYEALGINPDTIDPGRVTVRRLNRREYSNTIRDLLGVSFDAETAFPPDDTGFGFDNIGDTLVLSPMLIEKYLAAANDVVKQAVPHVTRVIPKQSFGANDFRNPDGDSGDRMTMKKPRSVERTFDVAEDGMYTVDIILVADGSFEFCPQRCTVSIAIDGEVANESEYGWNDSKPFPYAFERNWSAGEHRIAFKLDPLPLAEEIDNKEQHCDLDVKSVVISGPKSQSQWEHPPGYKNFFTRDDPPNDAAQRRLYARDLLTRFATRAFRRPADSATIEKLIDIAESVYSQNDQTFEAGIAQAMIPVLASPRFLFRIEKSSLEQADEQFPLVDEYSLASRLSYFLWSTMPDERLLTLASEGQLRANWDEEVKRMLEDRRSLAMVRSFVGQWLRTQDVEKVEIDSLEALGVKAEFDSLVSEFRRRGPRRGEQTGPTDPEADARRKRYSELKDMAEILDSETKQAMRLETEMLFEHIATENRSVLEVIDPGYTFVNEKLAEFYGIAGVHGRDMQKVDLPADGPRGGILTHGSMLTVTSNPTRTSPVKRGLFVLENLLGTPSPPAPPNVPLLEDAAEKLGNAKPSLRELLAIHRESALCASCHSRMDPLGLALEQFNALGMFRTEEDGKPIDASGTLVTGESFADVRELRRVIATNRSGDFYRCLSQKMLIYALGRGLDYNDEHTIDEIVEALQQNQGRYQVLIRQVVDSPAFQRKRTDERIEE